MKFELGDMRSLVEALGELEDHAREFGKLNAAALAVEIGGVKLRAVFDGNEWEVKEDADDGTPA